MSTPTVYRTTTAIAMLVALTGCIDQDPSGPTTADGRSVALSSARQPEHSEFVQAFSVELPCGSFTGLSEGTLTERATTFFDRAGNPVRLAFHIRYEATITNLSSGEALPDNAHYNGKLDLVTGAIEVNGLVYNVKGGIRIKDIGRIVFDPEGNIIFEAGRHDADAFGDATSLYCAALA